jgi:hypothetical protein
MVTANTRYKRKPFAKRVRALEHNLVALTALMVTLTGLHLQTVQVLLIVIAAVTVFYPGPLPLVTATSALLLRPRPA